MILVEADFCESGIPLHYYLTRWKSVNLATVKMLVESHPTKSESVMLSSTYKLDLVPIQFLLSNNGIDNLVEIASYLLRLEPDTIRRLDRRGRTLLHRACMNNKGNLALVKLLFNAWPDATQIRDNNRGGSGYGRTSSDVGGKLPIHKLCGNSSMVEKDALEILRFMVEINPSFPEIRDIDGSLPMHEAAINMGTAFCKQLIDAYPEALKVTNNNGKLPIHLASSLGNSSFNEDPVGKIQYMLQLYPELTNKKDGSGWLPIHCAASLGGGIASIKSLELLIKHDPASVRELAPNGDKQVLPIHLSNIRVDSVHALYDEYPEAIFRDKFSSHRFTQDRVLDFE